MTRARVLRLALLWLLVSAVVWLATIWRWQGQRADVGALDIVLELVLLPVWLTGVLAGAIWLVGRAHRHAVEANKTPAPAVQAGAKPDVAAALLDDSWASAAVLAEQVVLSAGVDPEQIRQAVGSYVARPGLDPELTDVDGMPAFTARHPELDVDAWLAQQHGEAWPTEVARALTLLEPVLQGMLDQLLAVAGPDAPGWRAWSSAGPDGAASGQHGASSDGPPEESPVYLSGVARPASAAMQRARQARAPRLQVRLLLPDWPAAVRAQAVAWVKSRCGGLLDWAEVMSAQGVGWTTDPLALNEDIWTEIDQTLVRWHREGRPELLLLLAADSAIAPEVVERMQARGELFTAQHQGGRVPGEAAAGLLLGSAHWLGQVHGAGTVTVASEAESDLTAMAVRMWRPVRTRRDKSADALGRLGTQAVEAALRQVQERHQPLPEALLVVSDADHRASRGSELYESLVEVMPAVDPMQAVTRVGQGCGDLGVAGVLVPGALACGWLRTAPAVAISGSEAGALADASVRGEPVALAVHLQGSHERVIVPFARWSRLLAVGARPVLREAA